MSKKITSKYKEILIKNQRQQPRIYYFELDAKPKISGFYAIDRRGDILFSVCVISQLLKENIYEKLKSKFLDISNDKQKQFFLISNNDEIFNNLSSEKKDLIGIIKSNNNFGTPRKFIVSENEKINIELETTTTVCESLNKF